MPLPHTLVHHLADRVGGPEVAQRAARLHFRDAGHGYDVFGLNADYVAMVDALASPWYHHYFRVRSTGHENLPARGPAILAANHSGTLPYDALMMYVDVLHHTDPPRIPRVIADYFVPWMPLFGAFFARCGVVTGARGSVEALLEAGDLVQLFPEGVWGIGKPWRQRYQLQTWRQGHCELAIRHRAPVVPVAIIGAEEQMPQLARIPLRGPLPYFPVFIPPIPLPVRYHIYYGEPIRLDLEHEPADADDPQVVAAAAVRVKKAVRALMDRGLAERRGVFR